eukprot:m.39707 g.39707  ORF g.39707 m.39707 type:complete len:348 (-) comp14744_c0_seq7:713-1756(-)
MARCSRLWHHRPLVSEYQQHQQRVGGGVLHGHSTSRHSANHSGKASQIIQHVDVGPTCAGSFADGKPMNTIGGAAAACVRAHSELAPVCCASIVMERYTSEPQHRPNDHAQRLTCPPICSRRTIAQYTSRCAIRAARGFDVVFVRASCFAGQHPLVGRRETKVCRSAVQAHKHGHVRHPLRHALVRVRCVFTYGCCPWDRGLYPVCIGQEVQRRHGSHGRHDAFRGMNARLAHLHTRGTPALHDDGVYARPHEHSAASALDGSDEAFGDALRAAHRVEPAIDVVLRHAGVNHKRALGGQLTVVTKLPAQNGVQRVVLDTTHRAYCFFGRQRGESFIRRSKKSIHNEL